MKITRKQIRKIIEERLDGRGMSEYGLYDKPGATEAEAELDALLDEVALFMGGARKRLDTLIQKYESMGAEDTESRDMIYAAFEDAKSGIR